MSKDVILPFNKIGDSQTITKVTEEAFKKEGLNCHVNEVIDMVDDHSRGIRKLTVKTPTLTFCVGKVPWHKDEEN